MPRLIVENFLFVVVIYLASAFYAHSASQEVLYVGTGTSAFSNRIYLPIYQDFEHNTGIKIVRVKLDDIQELDDDDAWYTYNAEPIDVINGQATSRLAEFYQRGKIAPINKFWEENHFDQSFGHLKKLVTVDGNILGMPFNVYSWQILYLKSNVGPDFIPPKTLDDLVKMCQINSEKGVATFHLMTNTAWTQMAWFEYIILRTHGLSYFNELVNGKHSYTSEKVKVALQHWKKLIDAGCYSQQYGQMNWKDAVHFFLRKKFSFMFTGNTLTTFVRSEQMKEDIDFFTFPKIANIARYETAPTNVYLVSKLSNKKAAIEKFLLFMAKPEIQESITQQLGCLPANSNSRPPTDPYGNKISKIISDSAGTSAFIDRLLLPDFERESRVHFNNFIKSGDIKAFTENLEQLRVKHYSQQ